MAWVRTPNLGLRSAPVDVWNAMRLLGLRSWAAALAGAIITLVAIGIPTVLVPNPWFTRMIPSGPQDYVLWVTTAAIAGLVMGTFVAPKVAGGAGKTVSGGFLSFLAVGCPICNKLVVLLLGTSGALKFFDPAQLYIGILALALLAWTLVLRSRSIIGCSPGDRAITEPLRSA